MPCKEKAGRGGRTQPMLFPRHIRKLSYASTIRGNECLCLIQGLFSPAMVFRSGPCAGASVDGCNFWVARDSTRMRTSQSRVVRAVAAQHAGDPTESRYRQPNSGLVHTEVIGAKTNSVRSRLAPTLWRMHRGFTSGRLDRHRCDARALSASVAGFGPNRPFLFVIW